MVQVSGLSGYCLIQIGDQSVDVNAMGSGPGLDILVRSGKASDAMQAVVHERTNGLRIFPNHLVDGHTLADRFTRQLLHPPWNYALIVPLNSEYVNQDFPVSGLRP
jgi:hypothetical protein